MRLGNLEHDIFPLGLGTNTFSNPSEPAEYETVLDAFVAGGRQLPGHGGSVRLLGAGKRGR